MAFNALLLACFASASSASEGGFDHFYNLEYGEAIADFRRHIDSEPRDPASFNHLAQAILYRALYRSGMLEESLISGESPLLAVIRQPRLVLPADEDREFTQAVQTAMALAKARLESDPLDTKALFVLGAAHGLRANYKFLVRKAWLGALRDTSAGLRLHQRVSELDSANVDSKLLSGVHDYVVATLPASLRVLSAVAGMHGDKERGLSTIREVAARGRLYQTDARILLAALYRHEKRPRQAAELLDELHGRFARNHLFVLAGISARVDARDLEGARQKLPLLSRVWKNADPAGEKAGVSFTTGLIDMRSGELDHALEAFSKTSGPKSLVYQGHVYDLKGDREMAVKAYKAAIQIAPKGRCSRRSERYLTRPYTASDGG